MLSLVKNSTKKGAKIQNEYIFLLSCDMATIWIETLYFSRTNCFIFKTIFFHYRNVDTRGRNWHSPFSTVEKTETGRKKITRTKILLGTTDATSLNYLTDFFWRAYYLHNGANLFLKSQLIILIDLRFNHQSRS